LSDPGAGANARSHARAGAPLRADVEVRSNRVEGEGSCRMVVRVPGWPSWQPGQFLMLSPGALEAVTRYDPLLPRPMAIYRTNDGDGASDVEVLYKVSGRGTRLLADASPGERVRIVGPLGTGFELPRAGEHAVLVGGGTGIASLHGLAESAQRLGEVTVILGARDAGSLMAAGDFTKLGVNLRIATEDGSQGIRGLVTDVLEEVLTAGEGAAARVYACGPTPMMRRCAEQAAAHGVPCIVSLENGMACGFGVCLGCAVPLAEGGFALVCNRGPVFEAGEIAWEGLP
jgi:dihydroorotate dehydrogenase electron transfer subunit